ncbi:MAG: hypothetical protein WC341_17925 [Bacteroidales bacterium]|jgi:hypothetical protein
MKIAEFMQVFQVHIQVNDTTLAWMPNIHKWRVVTKKRIPNTTGFELVINIDTESQNDAVCMLCEQAFKISPDGWMGKVE